MDERPPQQRRQPIGARRRVAVALGLATLALLAAALAAGSDGWSLRHGWAGDDAALIVWQIRAPRAVGAWLTGALLGLAGAIAQGLFRNPLADPYLLGSAAGATLGVVLVLAAGVVGGADLGMARSAALRLGLVGAATVGAWAGVALTLLIARGGASSTRLLLGGVIVGVLLSALADAVTVATPETLRGRQAFLLGSTSFLGWTSCWTLALGAAVAAPVAWRLARLLDALVLGSDSARSLGVAVGPARLGLIGALALATGIAVSQAGLVAFVGLVAPHIVRRYAPGPHAFLLLASAGSGGVLLLAADVLARSVFAPQELPVGLVTAVLGGGYLLWLLQRRGPA